MNKSHVWRAFAAVALWAAAASPALADAIDLNLNDDAARLAYATTLAEDRLELDLGWLHHQDKGNAITVSLGRVGEAGGGVQSVTAGIGGRIYALDPDIPALPAATFDTSQRGMALGIGGFFRFKMANYDRIGFAGHAYYAPDVLAFGDSKDVTEVEARVTYSIVRDADVYLGLRFFEAGFEGFDHKFDNGLHLGIRLEF